MKVAVLSVVCLVAVLAAADTSAQYIYLDANGDGRNKPDEQVPRLGWTHVDVWLDTARNRDGRSAQIGRAQGLAEYSFVIHAAPRVEWGGFTPAGARMKIVRGPLTDSMTFFVGVTCQPPLGPGRHRLGRIRFRSEWGLGPVSILPCAVLREPVSTFIRTTPGGQKYRLGPTITIGPSPGVVAGDWRDMDGVSFSLEPRGSAGPVQVSSGSLYLGWNRMKPPYELRIENGNVVVNGYGLPPEEPRARVRRKKPSSEYRAEVNAQASTLAIGRALHGLGLSDSLVMEGIAAAYRFTSTVESVKVTSAHSLAIRSKELGVHNLVVRGWEARGRAMDPDAAMAAQLTRWSQHLHRGGMLQIYRLGHSLASPGYDLDDAIESLQHGEGLSSADSVGLGRVAHSAAEWEAIRHPVRLRRVRP